MLLKSLLLLATIVASWTQTIATSRNLYADNALYIQQQQQHNQQHLPQTEKQRFPAFDVSDLQQLEQQNAYADSSNNNNAQALLQNQAHGSGDRTHSNNNRNYHQHNNQYALPKIPKANDATESESETLENVFRLQLSGLNAAAGSPNIADDTQDDSSNDNNKHNAHKVKLRSQSYSAGSPYTLTEDLADADDADEAEELAIDLPYGIQNVRKRVVRSNPKSTTYQSLCPTKRISIPLETSGYEYRPSHYIEVTCAHNYAPTQNYDFNKNKICSEAGFSCIQLNRTIHLIRRNKAATVECWESEIRIVPSGCECMWPKHNYGDIVAYHEAQKRYTPNANVRPNADYSAGEGYLQIPRQVARIDLNGQRHEAVADGVGFEAYEFN